MNLKSIVVFFIFTAQLVIAQNNRYINYSVNDGLPSSQVYDMHQDGAGGIWFATDRGLSYYDGYDFENYTTKDGLPGNTVLKFYPQANGQIWGYCYHTQSLFYFNHDFDGFYPYKYNDVLKKLLHPSSLVKCVLLDAKSNLTLTGVLINKKIKISPEGKVLSFSELPLKAKELKDTFIVCEGNYTYLDYDGFNDSSSADVGSIKIEKYSAIVSAIKVKENDYVFLSGQKLYALKDREQYVLNDSLEPIELQSINDSMYFVGYREGGMEIYNSDNHTKESFLNDKSVTNVLIDHNGNYWFSTLNSGIYYLKNKKIKFLPESKGHIKSILTNNGQLYMSYYNGLVLKYAKNNIDTIYTPLVIKRSSLLTENKSKEVLIYHCPYLYNQTTKDSILVNHTTNLSEVISEPYVSINSSRLLISETPYNSSILPFRGLDYCQFKNEILIATSSGLLVKKNDSLVKLKHNSPLLSTRIDDIDVNHKGDLCFMATQGEGVLLFDGTSVSQINTKQGLPSNIVKEIYVENDSTLWVASSLGISKITFIKNNLEINSIGFKDGLASNEIQSIAISNDTVYLGTKVGLNYFHKSEIEKKYLQDPFFRLTGVRVNNQNESLKRLKNLSYKENNLEFSVNAIAFNNNTPIKYKYRIKELNLNWTYTNNRLISFTQLPPGEFTLEAQVIINNQIHAKKIICSFVIAPPFWETWWYSGVLILLIGFIIYLFFKFRVLLYNKDLVREFFRVLIKRLKREEKFIIIKSNGEDIKLFTHLILYVKSAGNYIDIITEEETFTIRYKIGEFKDFTPDPLEFLRVHRSYIIRIDKVNKKGKNWVNINGEQVPVGESFKKELDKVQF